jgi:hypothetical protein
MNCVAGARGFGKSVFVVSPRDSSRTLDEVGLAHCNVTPANLL